MEDNRLCEARRIDVAGVIVVENEVTGSLIENDVNVFLGGLKHPSLPHDTKGQGGKGGLVTTQGGVRRRVTHYIFQRSPHRLESPELRASLPNEVMRIRVIILP